MVYKPVGTTSPPETASKRSKVTIQPEKVIPAKHYLEPSAEQQAPKRAKVTRKFKLEAASSDEETETDTEALVSRIISNFVRLPAFANIIANLAQSKAVEQFQTSKKCSITNPLQVLEQGSLSIVCILASTVFPTQGFEEQDSDTITSSSY
ncbi:hypothetical protein RHMOL_Rhmol03G0138900 [Rhododendron molle]|uniref:Uncharacterized protein n=1 Tax=Rhododendron molle TaxID=49168 RepID=A0ACC0PF98_RHOML|nr:hypothetical protein RHMOL_Rhmol03G0138900 [Rhododendron molle]